MRLKELTELNGVSGYEGKVRDYIINIIKNMGKSYKVDRLGNVIVKNEGRAPARKLLFCAHMDEVGLVVTRITPSGYLKFKTAGGVNPNILVAKTVEIGDDKILGVIGSKPFHLLKESEAGKEKDLKDFYIDIGANSKEEAMEKIHLGDYIAFKSSYVEFGSNLVKAKALDDRVGVEIFLSILEENLDCEFSVAFTVMEESGLRGARVVAPFVEPDLGIILEGTISADMHDIKEHEKVTRLRFGPSISIMDRGTIYDWDEIQKLKKLAKDNGIPYQMRESVMGGTDAAAVHIAKLGCKALGIAVPCRYIHSPVSVASLDDIENTRHLLLTFIKHEGGL
ncbi:MAG: M42 family metallopeptidase [Oscillospiraceae bacterium]|nr:M42 family metallopeptidase [Oscillospiraceae bacterium]